MASAPSPRIEVLESFTVVGLELVCSMEDIAGIPALWEDLFKRFEDLAGNQGIFGVCLPLKDNPQGFRYLACGRMDDAATVPAGMVKATVPGAKFAVYPFHGIPAEMMQVFTDIYGTRLGEAGLQPDPSYICLESYPEDCWDEATGKLKADLYISVL